MATKKIFFIPILFLSGLGFYCKKKAMPCPKFGYEFTYFKPGVIYTPELDSFPLGESITLEAVAPKTFWDEEKQYFVTLSTTNIFGSLGITKTTNDNTIPVIGAMDDVELVPIIGTVLKDSVHFTEGQLKNIRTLYWTIFQSDSFKVKIKIKPKIKGIFFVGMGQQSSRDIDCALYKYFLKVKNTNQHLHYLSDIYNGNISEDSKNFAYCFKVY